MVTVGSRPVRRGAEKGIGAGDGCGAPEAGFGTWWIAHWPWILSPMTSGCAIAPRPLVDRDGRALDRHLPGGLELHRAAGLDLDVAVRLEDDLPLHLDLELRVHLVEHDLDRAALGQQLDRRVVAALPEVDLVPRPRLEAAIGHGAGVYAFRVLGRRRVDAVPQAAEHVREPDVA